MATSERGQKAKKLAVPNLEEDPAERKRVLNVLAQRRYRRRKKEHLQRLEKLNDSVFTPPTGLEETENVDHFDLTSTQLPYFDQIAEECQPGQYDDVPQFLNGPSTLQQGYGDLFNFDSSTSPSFNVAGCNQLMDGVPATLNDQEMPGSLAAFEAALCFPLPSLSASPSVSAISDVSHNNSSPNSLRTVSEQNGNFPDETYLPMTELNLLRGAMSIAQRLGCDSIIWSLEANSLFYNTPASAHAHLPVNLRPTRAQLTNPHHPTLDILPWPSVRDRLILMFSQPENMRPPSARSPTALVEFVYDFEDPAEGARIFGDDPYSDENWEVGEKLFQNWWWAFDRRVLNRSNQLRRNRGAALLGTSTRVQEIE